LVDEFGDRGKYSNRPGHPQRTGFHPDITWVSKSAGQLGIHRTVLASLANIAIVSLHDVLSLGSDARMNLSGTVSGNWKWRHKSGALTREIRERL